MLPEHFKLAMCEEMWILVILFELEVMNVFSPNIIFVEDDREGGNGTMISRREAGFVTDREIKGVPVKYVGGLRLINI